MFIEVHLGTYSGIEVQKEDVHIVLSTESEPVHNLILLIITIWKAVLVHILIRFYIR